MYRIGDEFKATHDTFSPYKIGQIVSIFENQKELARYIVEEDDGFNIKGKIVVTCGHKRVRK